MPITPPEMSASGQIIVGLIGLANIGGLVYLVKIVIAPVALAVKSLTTSVEALYSSRNAHEVEIAKINTIHRVKGCENHSTPISGV